MPGITQGCLIPFCFNELFTKGMKSWPRRDPSLHEGESEEEHVFPVAHKPLCCTSCKPLLLTFSFSRRPFCTHYSKLHRPLCPFPHEMMGFLCLLCSFCLFLLECRLFLRSGVFVLFPAVFPAPGIVCSTE